jgi:prostaglandin-E synthase 1
MLSLTNPAFAPYAIAAGILGAHLILLAFWTGTVRAMKKQFVNPEDAKLNKADASEVEHPDVLRTKRAHQNALENAVPFFAVGALYVATGASVTGAKAYCFTFLAARLLHSVFYLRGIQPFRTISFAIGALATLGMAVHVVRAAL